MCAPPQATSLWALAEVAWLSGRGGGLEILAAVYCILYVTLYTPGTRYSNQIPPQAGVAVRSAGPMYKSSRRQNILLLQREAQPRSENLPEQKSGRSPIIDEIETRGNSRGVFGRKNLQDLKKAYFVLSTRKT